MVGSAPDEKSHAWIDTTQEPVVITDEAGRVLALNGAFERLAAIPRSQVPDDPVEDLIIPPRFRSAYRAARRMALTQGRYPVGGRMSTFAAVPAGGGELAVNLSVARASEDPVRVATWVRDVTEDRASVGQDLRREVLYERAEELAGLGSWDWMPANDRMLWSDNLFRIYGLRPGEITPSIEYTAAHCHPDDKEVVRQSTSALARAGLRAELRYRYVWPDETLRHLISTVVSVQRSGRRIRRAIGAVQDVTERHQAERELAAHFAVSDALSTWVPGKPGARRLLRDLAEALEFELGVMMIPRGAILATWVVWQDRAVFAPERESALSELRLTRNVGLPNSSRSSREPARIAHLTDDAAAAVRAIDDQTGFAGALAEGMRQGLIH